MWMENMSCDNSCMGARKAGLSIYDIGTSNSYPLHQVASAAEICRSQEHGINLKTRAHSFGVMMLQAFMAHRRLSDARLD